MAPTRVALSAARLLDDAELRPLAPLLYFAWADGRFVGGDGAAFRAPLVGLPGLDDEARSVLTGWLDPENPPAEPEIDRLRREVRRMAGDRIAPSLTVLSREQAMPGSVWAEEPGEVALTRAEHALGIDGAEALRELVETTPAPTPAPLPTTIDVERLREHLALPYADLRRRVLELLGTDDFQLGPELSMAERREKVLEALKILAREGIGGLAFPEEFGGADSPGKSIAAFETLGFGDLSINIKFGVQFGLYGGGLYQLGTRRHHEAHLAEMISLETPGAYAMTEISHGSNVRGIETTATYDVETGEFVVHTPHEGAGKEWIGNAALHGRNAVVFAQLFVGGEGHGVHALLVPIRDEAGEPMPGVRVEDNGPKMGLNGVDNGRLWFDRVRVPRENLLDRFAEVSEAGEYHSPIESEGRRFFTMLGTLVAGRISVAGSAVSVAKTAMTVAIRYSARRRQFGPKGKPEIPILDFTAQQRLLMPKLATTYALHYAVREIVDRYDHLIRTDRLEEEGRPIEAWAAGYKAIAAWHAIESLQTAREAMGGRGYHADNRVGPLLADVNIFATFEGANVVLLQLVAKSLLSDYRDEMKDLRVWGIVRYLADRAGTRVSELNPVTVRRTDPDHLRDPDFHAAAFQYREHRLLESAARRLKRLVDDGLDPFDAMNAVQDHLLTLARAHTDRLLFDAFRNGVARAPSPALSDTLDTLAQLFALHRLEEDRAWFLEAGYFEPAKSKAIRLEVNRLCGELREVAVPLVDAFGIPDAVLRARDALSEPT